MATIKLPEQASIDIVIGGDADGGGNVAFPTRTDTSGLTVGAYLTPVGGSAVLVGTPAGAAAGSRAAGAGSRRPGAGPG